MSLTAFKPELMHARLVLAARQSLAAEGFTNTQIGATLKEKGTKVAINTLGAITAVDTDEDNPMTYQNADTTAQDLTIEMDKTIAVKLRDADLVQIEASGEEFNAAVANRMVYELNNHLDKLILGKYSQATALYETGTTKWQFHSDAREINTFLAGVHRVMDEAGCETDGRFLVLPHIGIQALRIYLASRQTALGDQTVSNGIAFSNLAGFARIYQSGNVVSESSTLHGLAGNLPNVGEGIPGCIASAVQISPNVEAQRLEGFWAWGIRARITAGARVFKSDRCFNVMLNSDLLGKS